MQAREAAPVVKTLLASMPPREFDSAMAEELEARYEFYVANYATVPTIKSNVRRIDDFLEFGHKLFSLQGRRATDRDVLASDSAARLYLVNLADMKLGKTVVPAATTMIQTHRALAHRGIHPLRSLKSIQYLLDAVRKNTISQDKQAPGLIAAQITMILRAWAPSKRWDEVMIAAVLGIGFQATLRPIEISSLGSKAVWWVTTTGKEVRCDFRGPPPPPLHELKGIIMALLPRKNKKGHMSYIPSPAGMVVGAMRKHALNMRSMAPDSLFFFPARMQPPRSRKKYTWHSKAKWVPNPNSPFSQKSIADVAIPTALMICCNIPRHKSAIYSGYSLRVGGTTHHEESGTAEAVRKNLAEWMSLATARHYLQHAPAKQFGYLAAAAI